MFPHRSKAALFSLGVFGVMLIGQPQAVLGSATDSLPPLPAGSPAEPAPSPGPDPALDPLATLEAVQVQELLQWLSRHAPDPAALSQDALNRAALRSLLLDPRTGAVILPKSNLAGPQAPAASQPLLAKPSATSAYVRPGPPSPENQDALRKFLAGLDPETTTLLLDLRVEDSPPAPLHDAAALTSLFLPEGTPLFLLHRPPAAPALQSTTGDPVWSRRTWLLVDESTPPALELAARLLVKHAGAHVFGSPPPGLLTETTDRPLGADHLIRLPSATVHWPDGTRPAASALTITFPIRPRPASRRALLTLTEPAAVAAHLVEQDRPRHNEAALMAGLPPELATASLAGSPAPSHPDPVLQHTMDLLESAAVLKLDAPEEIKRAEPAR